MDVSPILISMKTAAVSILVTFFLVVFCARLVVGLRSARIRMVLDGILTLPLVLPPTVAGFFLLYIFGVKRPVGQFFLDYFGVKIAFSWSATVIAAVVISFPLMYRSARGAFEQVDRNMVDAAFSGVLLCRWRCRALRRAACCRSLAGWGNLAQPL